MRSRGANVFSSTWPARTANSSSSSRAKSGTCFSTSGLQAINHLVWRSGSSAIHPEHFISRARRSRARQLRLLRARERRNGLALLCVAHKNRQPLRSRVFPLRADHPPGRGSPIPRRLGLKELPAGSIHPKLFLLLAFELDTLLFE